MIRGLRLALTVATTLALCLSASPPIVARQPVGQGIEACFAERDGVRLLADHPDRLMIPASVMKLVTSAAALHFLGPDYRAETLVLWTEPPVQGELAGDLVWLGAGDPTWNRRFFADVPRRPVERLVRQLHDRGLRRVRGDLVFDTSRFPGRTMPSTRAIDELPFAFGAKPSAFAIDENTAQIRIAPGNRVSAPADVRAESEAARRLRLSHSMVTAPKSRHDRGTVDIQPRRGSMDIDFRGEYPISEPPYSMALAVPDGDRYAAAAIAYALEKGGIMVDGEIRFRGPFDPKSSAVRVAARLDSPPLRRWLEPILLDSQNWYAEMLLLQTAWKHSGEGRLDLALDLLAEWLTGTVGVSPGSFYFDDGSGVSPYNLITPRAVVRLLVWIEQQPWGPVLIDGLPTPGRGTLRSWQGAPAGTAAKTGTLRHGSSLAGWLKRPGDKGSAIAFACFSNHLPDRRPEQRRTITGRLDRLSKQTSQ